MSYKTTLRSVHIFANAKTSHNSNIHQNFPFALVGSGKSSHSIKMLPLTEVKGNLKI